MSLGDEYSRGLGKKIKGIRNHEIGRYSNFILKLPY
jgi:hypothetical protein